MKKNGRYFLIYTLILFSVAFVLILFSSFTGIRYKDAQDEKNKLFQGAQESVVKLTEKNEALDKENKELKKQVEELKNDSKTSGEDLANKETVIKNMDMLSQVQNFYRNKSYSKAKELLEQIDPTVLGENAKILYDSLKNRL